eukprot:2147642-Pyramimonas_sp.AAC.1
MAGRAVPRRAACSHPAEKNSRIAALTLLNWAILVVRSTLGVTVMEGPVLLGIVMDQDRARDLGAKGWGPDRNHLLQEVHRGR